jgi:hypothetical protein
MPARISYHSSKHNPGNSNYSKASSLNGRSLREEPEDPFGISNIFAALGIGLMSGGGLLMMYCSNRSWECNGRKEEPGAVTVLAGAAFLISAIFIRLFEMNEQCAAQKKSLSSTHQR